MLMGELAGSVFLAAIRGQTIDDVVLVEEIPHSEIEKIFYIPNGLDVGS